MQALSFAKTWRSALFVLCLTTTAFVTTACVSSMQLSHQTSGQRTDDSTSSLRVVTLESRFNWSEETASIPGS